MLCLSHRSELSCSVTSLAPFGAFPLQLYQRMFGIDKCTAIPQRLLDLRTPPH